MRIAAQHRDAREARDNKARHVFGDEAEGLRLVDHAQVAFAEQAGLGALAHERVALELHHQREVGRGGPFTVAWRPVAHFRRRGLDAEQLADAHLHPAQGPRREAAPGQFDRQATEIVANRRVPEQLPLPLLDVAEVDLRRRQAASPLFQLRQPSPPDRSTPTHRRGYGISLNSASLLWRAVKQG